MKKSTKAILAVLSAACVTASAFSFAGCGECKHENLKATEAVAATCTTAGNSAYWYCSDCEKYFSDEACATETTKDDTVIAATGHSYSTEWSKDSTYHWHVATCSHTDEVSGKASHTYVDGVCSVCSSTTKVTEAQWDALFGAINNCTAVGTAVSGDTTTTQTQYITANAIKIVTTTATASTTTSSYYVLSKEGDNYYMYTSSDGITWERGDYSSFSIANFTYADMYIYIGIEGFTFNSTTNEYESEYEVSSSLKYKNIKVKFVDGAIVSYSYDRVTDSESASVVHNNIGTTTVTVPSVSS